MSERTTLDQAIIGQVEKGTFDAHKIVTKLMARKDWPDIVTASAEELALERAQILLRDYRRNAERDAAKKSSRTVTERSGRTKQVRTGKIKASDIAKAPVYITGVGHVAYADCTADDFRTRAAMYERIAGKNTARAEWCLDVASVMERNKVPTFGLLGDAEIPALPDGDSLAAVMAAAS